MTSSNWLKLAFNSCDRDLEHIDSGPMAGHKWLVLPKCHQRADIAMLTGILVTL